MKKVIMSIGALLAASGPTMAGNIVTMGPNDYRAGLPTEIRDQAAVIRVEPAFAEISRPVQVCNTAYEQGPASDKAGGQVVGGIIGGLLGHQVGGGSGKTVATVGGAIAGSMIGGKMADGPAAISPVERCHTENRYVREQHGYRVTYRYHGHEVTETLSRDPGSKVNVRIQIRADQ